MTPTGRPRKIRDVQTFSAELPASDLRELRAIAEKDGVSVSTLLRQAIRAFLVRRRTIDGVIRIHDAESSEQERHDAESMLDPTASETKSLCGQSGPRGEGSCIFGAGHEGLHRDGNGKEWR
jgi:hypothetical protein